MKIIASLVTLASISLLALVSSAASTATTGGSCCICVGVIGDNGTVQQTCPCDSSYGGDYCNIQGSSCNTVGTCGNPDRGVGIGHGG